MKQLFGILFLIALFDLNTASCGSNCPNPDSTYNIALNLNHNNCCPKDTPEVGCNYNYYWRDFRGVFPKDALIAGQSASGVNRYVGQSYYLTYGLLPANIFGENGVAESYAGGADLNTTINVKILCAPAQYRQNFKWIPTTVSDYPQLFQNHHIVQGGFEIGHPLYIGRILQDGGITVGKFFRDAPVESYKQLHVIRNGVAVAYPSFEALAYDCD